MMRKPVSRFLSMTAMFAVLGMLATGCARNLPASLMETQEIGGVDQVMQWYLAENAEVKQLAGEVLDMKVIFTTEYARKTPVLSSLFGGFQEAKVTQNYRINGTKGVAFAVVERVRINGKAWQLGTCNVMNEAVYRAEYANPAAQTGDYSYLEKK